MSSITRTDGPYRTGGDPDGLRASSTSVVWYADLATADVDAFAGTPDGADEHGLAATAVMRRWLDMAVADPELRKSPNQFYYHVVTDHA